MTWHRAYHGVGSERLEPALSVRERRRDSHSKNRKKKRKKTQRERLAIPNALGCMHKLDGREGKKASTLLCLAEPPYLN